MVEGGGGAAAKEKGPRQRGWSQNKNKTDKEGGSTDKERGETKREEKREEEGEGERAEGLLSAHE